MLSNKTAKQPSKTPNPKPKKISPKGETTASRSVKRPANTAAAKVRKSVRKVRTGKPEKEAIKRSSSGTRLLQVPKRVWYKPLTWRNHPLVPEYKSLPKARKLFASSLRLLWSNKKLFIYIMMVYIVLDLVFVHGLSSGTGNVTSVKHALDGALHGVTGKVVSSGVSFAYLLATSGSTTSASAGIYQFILLLTCSLAVIWSLRQVLADHKVRMRDSFYQGMYPIVPFTLLFLLMSLQLVPLAAGGGIYQVVVSGGIAVHLWEKALWLALFLLLAVWSLRMITATIVGLYVVTLPGMTPMRAYRTAKNLVYGRRLLVWRKFIFLPIALLLLTLAIEVPLIFFVTPAAAWMFFVISALALPVVHAYLYSLYREML